MHIFLKEHYVSNLSNNYHSSANNVKSKVNIVFIWPSLYSSCTWICITNIPISKVLLWSQHYNDSRQKSYQFIPTNKKVSDFQKRSYHIYPSPRDQHYDDPPHSPGARAHQIPWLWSIRILNPKRFHHPC